MHCIKDGRIKYFRFRLSFDIFKKRASISTQYFIDGKKHYHTIASIKLPEVKNYNLRFAFEELNMKDAFTDLALRSNLNDDEVKKIVNLVDRLIRRINRIPRVRRNKVTYKSTSSFYRTTEERKQELNKIYFPIIKLNDLKYREIALAF